MQLEFKTRNPKQIEAAQAWLDPVIEEILYGGAKGGAKSYTGVQLIFGTAHNYPNTHWFIARKELIDLKKFTIPSIHEVHEHWGISMDRLKFDGQLNVYTLPNGSTVMLIACADIPSDPMFERFGSMQMTGGWIEEAGEIKEAAKANLWLSIGRWKNEEYGLPPKLLITANPKKGWLKQDFVDLWKIGKLPRTRCFIPALSSDNPYLPVSYTEKLRNTKDRVTRQRLAFGDWDYEEDKDALVTFDALTDSFSNTINKDGKRYMTVDVARKGRDATVIAIWDGLELVAVYRFEKLSTDETEQKIKDIAAKEKIPFSNIIIDEDGIGGGVVDHLRGVKGFVAKRKPFVTATEVLDRKKKIKNDYTDPTVYAGLKSQCGWKIAELINDHKVAFKVPDYREMIIEELTALLRDNEPDSDARRQLKPKKKVKEDLSGRSPDLGDCIIMRAYFELKRESLGESEERQQRVNQEQTFVFKSNRRNMSVNSAE